MLKGHEIGVPGRGQDAYLGSLRLSHDGPDRFGATGRQRLPTELVPSVVAVSGALLLVELPES